MRITWSLLLLFLVQNVSAQISGSINGYYGGKVQLTHIVQAVSPGGHETFSTTRISEKGEFRFRSEPEPGFYYLKIENRYIPYYYDPECKGSLKLTAPENLDNKLNPIEINYPCHSKTELTYFHELHNEWKKDIGTFIEENPAPHRDTLFTERMEKFEDRIDEKYAPGKEKYPYLQSKIDYQIADLKKIGRYSTEGLYQEYLKDKPIAIEHPAYLSFFVQFYQSRVLRHIRRNKDAYVDSLIVYSGFDAVSNLLMEEKLIDARDKAELALLTFLYKGELPNVKPKRERLLLEQAIQDAEHPGVRRAAQDMISKMNFLRRGSNPPPFSLADTSGKTITEDYFKEKFTYLQFWNTWNDAAVQDIMYMKELAEKYPNIQFLSISTDRDTGAFHTFINQHQFNWPVIHYQGKYELLENYGVETTPMYFLIDKHGRFLMSPAKEPAAMLPILHRLNEVDKEKRKPYEIIRDYED